MRYIERIRQPDEKILYSGTIHWVVYVPAFVLAAIAAVVLILIRPGTTGGLNLTWTITSYVCWAAAAFSFLSAWFRRWTTEIDVTDRRVIYKRGFIKRHTIEMNMDKVESVDVDQSIMGRLLDYGDVTVRGTGEGWEPLHSIGRPLDLRNTITAR